MCLPCSSGWESEPVHWPDCLQAIPGPGAQHFHKTRLGTRDDLYTECGNLKSLQELRWSLGEILPLVILERESKSGWLYQVSLILVGCTPTRVWAAVSEDYSCFSLQFRSFGINLAIFKFTNFHGVPQKVAGNLNTLFKSNRTFTATNEACWIWCCFLLCWCFAITGQGVVCAQSQGRARMYISSALLEPI